MNGTPKSIEGSSSTVNFSDGTPKDLKSIYNIASDYKKVVFIGIDTGESSSNPGSTFYEEGKAAMNNVIAEMSRLLLEPEYDVSLENVAYMLKVRLEYRLNGKANLSDTRITEVFDTFGFAIHHITPYLELVP